MQAERDGDTPDGTTAPPVAEPVPPPAPLYGTRESAAGLPYAASTASAGDIVRAAGMAPPQAETLAAPSARLYARLLDLLCCGGAIVVVQMVMWTVIMANDPALRDILLASPQDPLNAREFADMQQAMLPWAWLSTLLLLAVWFLYEVPMTALRGQTIGKLALGLRVGTGVPGARVGWAAATSRWAILALPVLLNPFGMLFQLVDCAWLLRDRSRPRCLHDLAARTDVARIGPRPPAA